MDTSRTPLIGIDQFLEEVTQIHQLNKSYADNLQKIKAIQENLLCIGWSQKAREPQLSQLESLMSQNKEYQKTISKEIKLGWSRKFSAPNDERIRVEQMTILTEQLKEIFIESKNIEIQFKTKLRKQLVKTIQITGNVTLSEEEIQHKVDCNEIDEFGCKSILTETEEARKKTEEITDRHEQIKQLERDIQELADLFQEMSDLVALQGVTVESIEEKVESAGMDVPWAVGLLREASASLDKARSKKKLLGILVASVVLLLLIVIIATSYHPSPDSEGPTSQPPTSTWIITTTSGTTSSTTSSTTSVQGDLCDESKDFFCIG